MVRTYKRKKGSRHYLDYCDDVMREAIEAVENHNNMSIRKAAHKFGVCRKTLGNRLQNKNPNSVGGPTALSPEEESEILCKLLLCSDYGYPLSLLDLRMIVKSYLDCEGRTIERFSNNLPGVDWASSFLRRHKSLSQRIANNIKRSRAAVSQENLKDYHDNLSEELAGIPPSNIFNYDETNLADKTSPEKFLYRRGVKYPDRIINFTKSCVTVMFCGAADGTLLAPFIVFKSDALYVKWTLNGPKGAPCCAERCCKAGTQFHNTNSGWFDMNAFEKWFIELFFATCQTFALPEGPHWRQPKLSPVLSCPTAM